ncbi:MAG: phosphoglucosamine mutase [marine bacterium B5-7]|nr:MAG: phosphoglucosamine mutase [marine bacterium B5-7]
MPKVNDSVQTDSERLRKRYFGTDGIRGRFGVGAMHPEFLLKLGWAIGRVLGAMPGSTLLIGKDTRISGYLIESALEAGLSAAGVNIKLLGPMPTPAISYLTRTLRAQGGIVISASHNPFYDNGIKIFSGQGTKLDDAVELAIEAQLDCVLETVDAADLGKASRVNDAATRYAEFCKQVVPNHISFKGLKCVIDCAHGATYHIAPQLFEELGASVHAIHTQPDGQNINADCGSTSPAQLVKTVLQEKADIGIAFDGDGDRLILCDHTGALVNGDQILYVIAQYAHSRGTLKGGVVGTVMSNLGLEQAVTAMGVDFVRTKVGDRHVFAELEQRGWQLGGESSGHLLNFDALPTGDGILSALQVLMVMCAKDKTLQQLAQGMTIYPQVMINVPITSAIDLAENPAIQQGIAEANARLAEKGRVLLRPSGTEPVIRVMVEGEDKTLTHTLAEGLAEIVKKQR